MEYNNNLIWLKKWFQYSIWLKKKPAPILNMVEKTVPILDLVECQLIEAVTASSTFPKLPPTNLHTTDCHTRLWWKYLFAPNSNTKSQHQGEDFPRFSISDRLSHQA